MLEGLAGTCGRLRDTDTTGSSSISSTIVAPVQGSEIFTDLCTMALYDAVRGVDVTSTSWPETSLQLEPCVEM